MKKAVLSLFVFLAALVLPRTVMATTPPVIINSATFNCDAVTFNYSVQSSFSPLSFSIFAAPNPATTLLGSQTHGTIAGTFNMTINLSPAVVDGTTLYVFIQYGVSSYIIPHVTSGTCSGLLTPEPEPEEPPVESSETIPNYRFFGGQGARAGLFIQAEDNGANNPVLTLYDINEESQGRLLYYISLNNLNQQYPADGGETVLLYENDAEFITLYRLANGVFQINLGPDFEGKVHVLRFTWDGGEPANVIYDTYFVSNTLPLWVLANTITAYS